MLRALARLDLLILDDWGPEPLDAEQRRDLLEIVEDRYECRSIIVTSQLPVDRWYEIIGNPTIADAILDRLVHNAYRIELNGESLRKQRAISTARLSTLTRTLDQSSNRPMRLPEVAGFRSEYPAGFKSECMAGIVGITGRLRRNPQFDRISGNAVTVDNYSDTNLSLGKSLAADIKRRKTGLMSSKTICWR